MPLGSWLSLVPTTEHQQQVPSTTIDPSSSTSSSQSSDTTNSNPTTPLLTTNFFTSKKPSTPTHHHSHDHHPSPNSFLKPMVLQSPPRRHRKPSSNSSFHVLPLLENSNQSSKIQLNHYPKGDPRSSFEVRSLQVCDIEKVKELHCTTLPVTYPTSFFYSLLGTDHSDKISLVATLPSTSVHGYFDVLNPTAYHPSSHPLSSSTHHAHLAHHHVTSPLSGRKPISLDVVGTITARISSLNGPTGPSVRILTLCVSPDYRRFGIGRLLLDNLLKQIKTRLSRFTALSNPRLSPPNKIIVNLHVQATNKVAYAFYTRSGFQSVCFKPAYYSDNPLKPLDPTLKQPSTQKPSSLQLPPPLPQKPNTSHPDDSDSETDDIDAWFLELSIDSY